ncbi:MAG: glycosyltransferase [Schleiferiaceae bacterium]|nr:glycosyltransferase [Schleiferiaceae bacterium]MDR9443055.1 glycosyltransferase [Schleiferiaceae bacterium]
MQPQRHLLLLSYYWHPDSGTGVNRIAKMAHYLHVLGWHITVLTATSEPLPEDHQAGWQVVRVPGFKLSQLWGGRKSPAPKEAGFSPSLFYKRDKSLKEKLLIWARLNLLVPDAKIGWYPSAVKKGKELLQNQHFDAILSTSPPPTVALVARRLARFSGRPWTADFRDPWTQIYYYETFPPGALAGWLNRQLESKVVRSAHNLVVVNRGFFPQPEAAARQTVIPNGYDPRDFAGSTFGRRPNENPEALEMKYIGTLKMNQLAPGFLRALERLYRERAHLKRQPRFEFVGAVDEQYRALLETAAPGFSMGFPGRVSHAEAIAKMQAADMLLLFIGRAARSKSVYSTKLFEYLRTGRPILAMAHEDGAAAEVIQDCEAGFCAGHEAEEATYGYLKALLNGAEIPAGAAPEKIKKYSFETLAAELNKVLHRDLNPPK